jgi:hypothetical protein
MDERKIREAVHLCDDMIERLERLRDSKKLELMEIRITRAKLEARLRELQRRVRGERPH